MGGPGEPVELSTGSFLWRIQSNVLFPPSSPSLSFPPHTERERTCNADVDPCVLLLGHNFTRAKNMTVKEVNHSGTDRHVDKAWFAVVSPESVGRELLLLLTGKRRW